MRLQKVLAERGVASRRSSAEMITAGLVKVNGAVAREPGLRVVAGVDRIEVNGTLLPAASESTRTILLYKPRGYICTNSRAEGKTVYDLLDGVTERVVPAGRLDKDSEGVLLLSNDGDLIAALTHPRFGQEKVYRVTVSGALSPEVIEELKAPIEIDGYTTVPARVTVLKERDLTQLGDVSQEGHAKTTRHVVEIILREGRNRQIRRLCERSGLRVHRLVRTRVGKLTLKGLKPGQWRDIRPQSG
ncbi:MAG: rRNA pseudouridine synthase [Lentisphaerae bacterium]|nr:rRNA pseudouridine synthase [Lentisphaerota bacterium]